MNDRTENFPSWLAVETLVRIREVKAGLEVAVHLEHVGGEALRGPHIMANWIRRRGGTSIADRPPPELALEGPDSWSLGPHIVRELVQVGG
jgi:hypothetical protein